MRQPFIRQLSRVHVKIFRDCKTISDPKAPTILITEVRICGTFTFFLWKLSSLGKFSKLNSNLLTLLFIFLFMQDFGKIIDIARFIWFSGHCRIQDSLTIHYKLNLVHPWTKSSAIENLVTLRIDQFNALWPWNLGKFPSHLNLISPVFPE